MAIMDPQKALEHEHISQFGGIKSQDRLTKAGASDIRNFRILPDGSLEKRCGYSRWLTLQGSIRGVWEGPINGTSCFFAVAGSRIYRIRDGEAAPTTLYFLPTEEGPVSFVYYRERLYLLDGSTLLRYREATNTFTVADGYTPLYGQNWHPTQMGPVKEPLNLVQNRIRLHYLNTTASTSFRLPYTAGQINRVLLDGVATTGYALNTVSMSVEIPTASTARAVEICFTLDELFNRRSDVLRNWQAIAYTDTHHETFLCTGGAPGYTVYRSAPVTDEMLAGSTAVYTNSDPLYIPEKRALTAGTVEHPITAICQNREQVLVMNDRSLWAIRHTNEESEDMRILLLRTDIGCSSVGGVTAAGDDLITVCESGVHRLHFSVTSPDTCTLTCLSEEIAASLSQSFLKNGRPFFHRATGELWLTDPSDTGGTILIWQQTHQSWVIYSRIRACLLFERQGSIYFGTPLGTVCYMDSEADTDDGAHITALYQSHFLSFSHPAFPKRSLRASLCADTHGGTFTLGIETEQADFSQTLTGTDGPAPAFFDLRTSLGRFRFLRYRIRTVGSKRIRIHFLSLSANN